MIRTRDFVVYIGVLLFLMSAISVTVTKDLIVAKVAPVQHLAAATANEAAVGVVAASNADERAAYIAAMREKLARGEGKIAGAPVVLASDISTPPPPPTETVDSRSVMRCGTSANTSAIVMNWDPSTTVIRTVEGARIVAREMPGASEDAEATAEPLLQLAMRHTRAAHDSCLPSDIVGIANDGTLILNGDAIRFQSTSQNTLIGYALDGFPIYGVASGDTLDVCGGTDTGAGYQYHIRADEDFVLGCFAATPAQFLN